MNQTPPEFKKLAESVELYDQSEAIGAKFGLHIDQVGELDAEIRDILNGVSESADFAKHVVERLEINRKLADEIVVEVNKAVFQTLREQMQSSEASAQTATQTASTISNIEQVGGFSIEKPAAVSINKITAADRGTALEHLENPPVNRGSTSGHEAHTEPLVDHLLQNSVSAGTHKQHVEPHVPDNLPIVGETPFTQTPINIPPKAPEAPKPAPRTGPDPYREMPK